MLTYPPLRDDTHDDAIGQPAETARLWVSDRQWLAMLRAVKNDAGPPAEGLARGGSDATGNRARPRHAASFRGVIRLAPPERPGDDHGTYLVHSRNISAGGMGFVHDRPLRVGTRCTVALRPAEGRGLILAARVAWCRPVDEPAGDHHPEHAHDVGVQFDQPIDLNPFFPAA
ncbi:MAG: PilZ domain-containing protein [Planctomycetota bacterium]